MRLSAPLILLMLASVSWQPATHAQLQPDNTLGTEASRVIRTQPEAAEIGGGAQRGDNLFHSFREFNVEAGGRVYFQDSAEIENILTRVTGDNASNILGTLGVLGNANLFLLNPNGIIFGPDATLDIDGSFTATTAEAFLFPGGEVFSAVNPDAPPLLTMSVPIGLQHNSASSSQIENQGILTAGQNLTLDGNRLQLTGRLQAGQDLTLQAQGTLTVRDTAAVPFIATSGQNLLLQGNQGVDIFALNHPDSGLFAGNDLTLRSPTPVIGDAHYWSGGHFRIEQLDGALGALTSPNDPVIRATGDVAFDSYTGASLHIFAGGSVTVPGAITITGPDPVNGIVETVTLSDGSTVEINGQTTPTLDIRAGTLAVNPAGAVGDTTGLVPGVPATGGGATSADITLGSIRNEGGTVFLTNQYQPNLGLPGGDMTVGAIATNVVDFAFPPAVVTNFQAQGGAVILDAREQLQITDIVDTSARVDSGLIANPPDDVTISARGGAVQLRAGAAITTANVVTSAFSSQLIVALTNGVIRNLNQEAIAGSVDIRGAGSFVETGDIVTSARAQAELLGINPNGAPIGVLDATARSGDIVVDGATSTTVAAINASASTALDAESVGTGFNPLASQIGDVSAITDVGSVRLSSGEALQITDSLDASASTDMTLTGSRMGDISTQTRLGAIALDSDAAIQLPDLNVSAATNVTATAELNLSADPAASLDAGFIGQVTLSTNRESLTINSGERIDLPQINGATDVTTNLAAAALGGEGGTVTGGTLAGLNVTVQGDAIALTADQAIAVDTLNTSTTVVADIDARAFGNFVEGGTVDTLTVTALSSPIQLQSLGTLEAETLETTAAIGVNANNRLDGSFIEGASLNTLSTTTTAGAIALTSGDDLTAQTLRANALATVQVNATADSSARGNSRSTGGTLDTATVTTSAGAITLDSGAALTATSIEAIADTTTGLTANATADAGPDTGFGANADATGGTLNTARAIAQGGEVQLNSTTTLQTGDVTVQANTRLDIDAQATAEADGVIINDPGLPEPLVFVGEARATGAQVGTQTADAQGGTVAATSIGRVQTADINTSAQSFADVNLDVRAANNLGSADGLAIAEGGITEAESVTATGGTIRLGSTTAQVSPLDGSVIRSNVISGDGDGGSITFEGRSAQVSNTLLTTTVAGTGDAGDIRIRARDQVSLTGSRLLTGRESGATGQGAGGTIALTGGAINLTEFSFLNTATFGAGDAGNTTLTSTTGDITLTDSSIFSLTAAQGNAGDIDIQAAGALRLERNSVISTTVALGATGEGGAITIGAQEGVFIRGIGQVDAQADFGNNPLLIESEPNNTANTAQAIDASFAVTANSEILFSEFVPHVAIAGESRSQSFDFYAFEIDRVGTQVTFDIDNVVADIDPNTGRPLEPADMILRLYDSEGNELAFNDNVPATVGGSGSTGPNDPYFTYLFNEPGTYVVRVSEFESRFADLSNPAALNPTDRELQTAGDYTLNISRVDDLLVSSGITTQTRSTGRSGNISIQAPIINIQNGGQISAETLSSGQAGDITLSPFGTGQILTVNIEGEGSQISGSTLDAGAGGNLTLASPGRINLRGDGALRVETSATGAAGNVAISTPTLAVQDPLSISATATETATPSGQPGGNINVNVSTLNFFAPATLTAETEGRAPAGRMTFHPYEADDSITVNFRDSGAVISTSTSAAGVGGTLQLRAPGAITLQGNGQLLAETAGAGRAGDIRVETAQFALRDGVEVSTSTEGTGVGGTIFVNGLQNRPAEQVIFQAAELSAETDSTAAAGDIRIRTGALVMGNNAEITTSTNDAGDGGDIFIDAGNRMQLSNATILAESNPIDDETDAPVTQTPGDAGQIRIATPRLALQNGAQISASNVSSRSEGIRLRALRELALTGGSQILASTDTGSAGNISVDASGGTVLLQGAGTRLAAETETETPSATSQAGTISITTSQFNVQDQAEVSISTQDGTGGDLSLMVDDLVVSDGRMLAQTNNGVAGSLTVNSPDRPADSVVLRGVLANGTPAGLSVEATGARGVAGQVQLNVRHLTVQANAEITAANQAGRSDGIFLSRLERLNLQSGGRITASTARGQAGNITLALDPGGIVRLDNGQIESAATAGGEAGSLTLQNSRTVDLSNGSSISVSSPQGLAGRLSVTTEQLVLNNSQITAQTGRTSTNPGEANIQLQGLELLVMQSNSLISAQALGDATGGNVAIDAPNGFVIGVPQENNDIIATAEAGNGGNIAIRAIRIFGFVDRTPDGLSFAALRANTTNDISASSEFGTSGSVVLDNLSVDPSQGLTALPETVVDAANQIGQVCPTGPGASEQLGRFVVTGRGGISPSPLGLQEDLGFSIDWMPDANPAAPADFRHNDAGTSIPTERQAAISEADGWQVDAEGRVQLVSTTAPAVRVGTAVQCP